MGTSALKSASITNLDATPVVQNTAGEGAPQKLKSVDGFVTAVAADAAGSTYKFCRVQSTVKVKALDFESEAQGAGKVQLGVYYSDSTVDGTAVANQGAVVNVNLFANDIDISAIVSVNEVNQSASYDLSKRTQPLWKAAGLSVDPGGYFDIVATVHTTAITTGTGKLGVRVSYAE